MKRILLIFAIAAAAGCSRKADIIIYGGTSAAVTAACSAAAKGCDVTVVCPDQVLGGMTTGGLGHTDIGNKQAVIGIARDFYRRVGEHYGKLEQWIFEPHVASEILESHLGNELIKVEKGWYVDSVVMNGTRIASMKCHSVNGTEREFSGDQFIDASYEGDLMARAGVSYRVGREDNSEYGESYNGSELRDKHQFPDGIDPYVVPGKPESGLLWGISSDALKPDGTGDACVQAYNFRICLTDDPENMIPIEKPEGYDPSKYELAVRVLEALDKPAVRNFFIWSPMPCRKTDINNCGPFSTDMIGMNHSYPEASYEERAEIVRAHKDYTLGLFYFFGNDPRVPADIRDEISRWGLPKDEYTTTGNWTHQLYLRECRRMVGEYVATQDDCEGKTSVEDGIGYAAYGMDSHNCERIVVEKDGKRMVKNEGDVQIGVACPYPISYRSITPKRGECTNLLVPVCLSASHIAYGSIRMEPVFMELGEVAGLAAAEAGPRGSVQEIDVKAVQKTLATDPYLDGREPDLVIDENSEYISVGEGWELLYGYGSYGASLYRFTGAPDQNSFTYNIPKELDGPYTIYTYKQKWGAARTDYIVSAPGDTTCVSFDRDSFSVSGQTSGEWFCLGTYTLRKGKGGTICPVSREKDMLTDALLFVKDSRYATIKDQGLVREYFLSVPEGTPKGLVFCLHGHNGRAQGCYPGFEAACLSRDYAICYPQASEEPGTGHVGWNVGYVFQKGMKVDDFKFLRRLGLRICVENGIDPRRIFLSGMSNGGEMCYIAARKHPEDYAAIASIAGLEMLWAKEGLKPRGRVPFLEVHGRKDEVSPWEGDYENTLGWGSFVSVDEAIGDITAINGCTDCETVSVQSYKTSGKSVILHRFTGEDAEEVLLYDVSGGTHSWNEDAFDVYSAVIDFFELQP